MEHMSTHVSDNLGSVVGFKSLFNNFKRMGGVNEITVAEAENLIKSMNTGILSADDIIKKMKITKNTQGVLFIGGMHTGKLNRLLKEGDLKSLIKATKLETPITAFESSAFQTLIGKTPEQGLKKFNELAATAKQQHPHLDTNLEGLGKLSDTAKRDLKKVESNLFKYFKEGSVIALTIGAVYVGADWIVKATEARKGCFMVTTINGTTTSCRVGQFSCLTNVTNKGNNNCAGSMDYYNTTLVLMHLVTLSDSDMHKCALEQATGIPVSQLHLQLANIVDNHYPAVVEVVKNMGTSRPNNFSICGISNDSIEGGVVPPCRMCDPTANPTSTTYIEPTMYGDNVTFQCVTNPSILDTITDTAASTGINLLDGVSKVVSGSIKAIGIAAVVLIVIIVLVGFVGRLFLSGTDYRRDINLNPKNSFKIFD